MAVAIIQAPQNTLLVIIIIYGVSFVQSQVIGPIMARESMKIAPVMILIGQVVFGIFFGFLGIMLAVPLTAMMLVLVQEIYVKDILGDAGGDVSRLSRLIWTAQWLRRTKIVTSFTKQHIFP